MAEISNHSPENQPLLVVPAACDVTCDEPPVELDPQANETPEQALARLTALFRATARVSDDYAVNAAFLVKAMRTLVKQGAAGRGMTWHSWARWLGIPTQRIQRYLRIADAKNPRAIRDEFLRRDRERAKKSRAKKKAMAPERRVLRDWARKAPLVCIVRVQEFIETEKMTL